MWRCPKCRSKVEDTFEVCWSCGTTEDGVEDESFVTADEAEPIEEPPVDLAPLLDDPLDDFAGTPWAELVECHMASSTVEAKFIADRLTEEGIPALADRQDINMTLGGFQPQLWGYGPKVRIRAKDLPRAQNWLKDFEARKRGRSGA